MTTLQEYQLWEQLEPGNTLITVEFEDGCALQHWYHESMREHAENAYNEYMACVRSGKVIESVDAFISSIQVDLVDWSEDTGENEGMSLVRLQPGEERLHEIRDEEV